MYKKAGIISHPKHFAYAELDGAAKSKVGFFERIQDKEYAEKIHVLISQHSRDRRHK